MKKKKKEKFPHSHICPSCAKDRGLRWPKNHCATQHYDTCPYCERDERPLTAVSDWLKPGEKELKIWD